MSNKIRQNIIIGVLIILAFMAGFSVGKEGILIKSRPTETVLVGKDTGQDGKVDFSLYWEVWDKAKEKFVGQTDAKQSVYGAIKGMVASFKDPFSVFFTPEESDKFFADLNGEFEGIGAELAIRDERLTVVSPLKDSPAELAGLKPKDMILMIDDVDSSSISFDEAITNIRGPRGSEVRLLVQREGKEPFEIKITRATIKIDSVNFQLREDGIGVIKIIQFSQKEETVSEVKKALGETEKAGAKGIILDMRNNPGGLLDSAIDIASFFIPQGVVVSEEGKNQSKVDFHTTGKQIAGNLPMVVLVNEGTASAAEIVAGAIKDSGRGKLVGQKTFGKGTVQDLVELKDGSNLKITVAYWLTPKGNKIDKLGIEPDIQAERSVEDIQADRDPQLEAALNELK